MFLHVSSKPSDKRSCYRFELAAQGVPVVVIKPGPVATAIWEKSGHKTSQLLAQLPPAAQEVYGLQLDTVRGAAAKWSAGTGRMLPMNGRQVVTPNMSAGHHSLRGKTSTDMLQYLQS
jgi:short-subunit dehydrogenase